MKVEKEYSVSKITRMIIHEQLRMHAGEHKAIISSGNYEKIKEEVLRLYDLYKLSENYKTGESVTESERFYADDLLLLSSHLLYSFFQFLKSNPSPDLPKDYLFSLLFQGILLLHYSLRNSNLNFQLKIVLLRLYCLVSAIEPAYSLFKSLDIKHIQFDTFSHVLYHDAALLPSPSSVSFLNSVNRFYVESLKEVCFPFPPPSLLLSFPFPFSLLSSSLIFSFFLLLFFPFPSLLSHPWSASFSRANCASFSPSFPSFFLLLYLPFPVCHRTSGLFK